MTPNSHSRSSSPGPSHPIQAQPTNSQQPSQPSTSANQQQSTQETNTSRTQLGLRNQPRVSYANSEIPSNYPLRFHTSKYKKYGSKRIYKNYTLEF